MSKNPNYKSNNNNEDNNNDKNDDDNANKKALRRDCCGKRYTRHITRVHLGGHGTGHSEQSGDIWIRKKNTPRYP